MVATTPRSASTSWPTSSSSVRDRLRPELGSSTAIALPNVNYHNGKRHPVLKRLDIDAMREMPHDARFPEQFGVSIHEEWVSRWVSGRGFCPLHDPDPCQASCVQITPRLVEDPRTVALYLLAFIGLVTGQYTLTATAVIGSFMAPRISLPKRPTSLPLPLSSRKRRRRALASRPRQEQRVSVRVYLLLPAGALPGPAVSSVSSLPRGEPPPAIPPAPST